MDTGVGFPALERGDRVVLLWLTRGEMTEALGPIPTEEIIRRRTEHGRIAGEILGVETRFMDFPDPWPEIMAEHTKAGIAGIYNYSIFQNGCQFIYVFECDDVQAAFDYLDKSPDCQKWNAMTSKMVEGSFDFSESEPINFMDQVFYLK